MTPTTASLSFAAAFPRFSINSSPDGLSPSTMSVTAFSAKKGVCERLHAQAIAAACKGNQDGFITMRSHDGHHRDAQVDHDKPTSISLTDASTSFIVSKSSSDLLNRLPVDTTPSYIASAPFEITLTRHLELGFELLPCKSSMISPSAQVPSPCWGKQWKALHPCHTL